MKNPFKLCHNKECNQPLYSDKVQWLPKLQIYQRTVLKLYNCPHCHSTGSVKLLLKGG